MEIENSSHSVGELKIPLINNNDRTVELLQLYVEDGQYIEKGKEVAEIESSKATIELVSPVSGYIKLYFSVGASIPIGYVLATFSNVKLEKQSETLLHAPDLTLSKNNYTNQGFNLLSPKAALLLESSQFKIGDLQNIGLITSDILKDFILYPQTTPTRSTSLVPPVTTNTTSAFSLPKIPLACEHDVQINPNLKNKKVSPSKKREIVALTRGQQGLINSSLSIQFSSERIRNELKNRKFIGGQILPIILSEFSKLLTKYPEFCSFYHDQKIYYHGEINVGVAIDLGQGLKVAVIKNAPQLSAAEIYAEILVSGLKYLNDEFTPEDLTGGTVTVTDLSSQDIIFFQPLLNESQAVILGIGGDSQAHGHPMTLNLVFDHRILSGKQVGEFLKTLRGRILNYEMAF